MIENFPISISSMKIQDSLNLVSIPVCQPRRNIHHHKVQGLRHLGSSLDCQTSSQFVSQGETSIITRSKDCDISVVLWTVKHHPSLSAKEKHPSSQGPRIATSR